MKKYIISCIVLLFVITLSAETVSDIALPAPRQEGGMPLMQALKERKSVREFSEKSLSPQVLSDLLWAAFGISRPDGKRTAPSARNCQEIAIYAVLPEGAYLYDAKANVLTLVAAGDFRKKTGIQAFAATAPLDLVYVADFRRMKGSEKNKEFYAGTDVGFISQNVYLFCASEGMGTVVRGWLDRDACAKALKLDKNSKVILAQTVGFPKQ
jgi:SagB-type dehydrogenase family enzyme